MKKYYFPILAATTMLFAASCSQDDELVSGVNGNEESVTFTVNLPGATQTRAIAEGVEVGKGNMATSLIWALYESDKTTGNPLETGTGNYLGNGTFSATIDMVKGLEYKVLFLAYNADNCAFDAAEGDDLKSLTLKSELKANQEAYDAFVACHTHQVNAEAVTTVTLTRPFAQVNVATTKEDLEKASTLKALPTQTNLVIEDVPTVYNVLTGEATTTADLTYAAAPVLKNVNATAGSIANEDITVSESTYQYLTMAYVLAGETADADKSMHNAKFEFLRDEEPKKVYELEISNLPIQRNYRTNVIGNILTQGENFKIVIDADFEEPAHIVNIWDGSIKEVTEVDGVYTITEASQLAWIAQQVNMGSSFGGKTVVLDNDIDLGGVAWTPIGLTGDAAGFQGTFDGQGHTISNLYIDQTAERKYQSAGLFGSFRKGVIKNFTVENTTVNNLDVTTQTSCGTAVVVGSAQFPATIENVTVKNAVVASNRIVGGIAGYFAGTISNCTVEGISLTATMDVLDNGSTDNGDKAGAIMAYANGVVTLTDNTVSDFTINAYRDCGGVAGCANDANCSITGNKVSDGMIVYESRNAKAIVGRHDNNTAGYEDGTNSSSNVTVVKNSDIVSNQDAFTAALSSGATEVVLGAGTYTLPNSAQGKTLTIVGTEDSKVSVQSGLTNVNGANITFKGVTIQSAPEGEGYNNGFSNANSVSYIDCSIEGTLGLYSESTFNNCKFNIEGNYYNVWTWGAEEATFKGCTFNCDGKALLVYACSPLHQTVNITDCVFNDNGDDTVTGKAAIEITNTYADPVRTYDVIITNTKVNGFSQTKVDGSDFDEKYGSVKGSDTGTNVWGNKCELPNTQINVVIDGVDVY